MNAKALIPLALILVVLAGVVFLRQQGKEETTIVEQADLESLVPQGLEQDAVRRITLYKGAAEDAEKVVLARDEATAPWHVASQFNAPAVQEDVDKFLDTILDLQGNLRETVEGDAGLDRYQLKDDQAIHLAVATENTAEAEPAMHVLLGKQAGTSTLFVRRAGEQAVYDEQAAVRQQTGVYDDSQEPTASKWIDKEIFTLEEDAKITSVSTTQPDKSLTIAEVEVPVETPETPPADGENAEATPEAAPPAEPQTTTEWQVTEGGPNLDFKADSWTSSISRMKTLRASDVVDPANLAEYGLDTPAYRTTIKVEGRSEDIVLEGGRPEKNSDGYIRVAGVEPPVVYKVYGSNFELAFPKTGTLFAYPKFVEGATVDQVSRVEVVKAGAPDLVIEPENEAWKVVQPALALTAQETTLRQIATTIANLTPVDYAGDGTETGPFDWTITAMVNDEPRVLHLGADSKAIDGVYARFGDDTKVYTISRTDANKLMITPDKAYQMAMFDATVDDVQGVVFQSPEQRLVLAKEGEDWKLADGATTYPVDTVKARAFVTSALALQGDGLRLDAPATLEGDALYSVEIMKQDGRSRVAFAADPADASRLIAYADGVAVAMSKAKPDLDALVTQAKGVAESKQEPAPEPAEETPAPMDETAPASASDEVPVESPNTAPLQVDFSPIVPDDAAALASPNTATAPAAQ